MGHEQVRDRTPGIGPARSARAPESSKSSKSSKVVSRPGGVDPTRPGSLHSAEGLLAMQRTAGNSAVLAAVGRQGGVGGLARPSGSLAARARSPLGESRACGATCGHTHGDGLAVQRHSSWEHSLLGDAKPDVLAKIGTWQDLVTQTEREGTFVGSSNRWYKVNPKKATVLGTPKQQVGSVDTNLPGVGVVAKGEVMHVLVQEMARVAKWQTSPPTEASTDEPYKKSKKDPEFEVVTVRLPATDPTKSLLVTYGELNTLADFYGSLEIMKSAAPKQRLEIVQSVRKETFLRLKEIYSKLNDSLTKTEKKNQDVIDAKEMYSDNKLDKTSFKGAAVPDFISGKAGQADLLAGDKPVIGQGIGAGGGTNAYGATLARNACHFVPESWHAWAGYHDAAITAARDSRAALRKAKTMKAAIAKEDYSARPGDKLQADEDLAEVEAQVSERANEALLNNGFGDHYLQDSYAAGHMINKTQIMQWYVEYIDKNDEWDYFKDDNWRRVQQMAYGQGGLVAAGQYDKSKVKGADPTDAHPNLPRNPQSVENIGGDDWMVRFAALGLQVPPSLRTPGSPERAVIEWWQRASARDGDRRTLTGADLLAGSAGRALGQPALEGAMLNLLADGIARTDEANDTRGKYMQSGLGGARFRDFTGCTLLLRSDYVPKDLAKFKSALAHSKRGNDAQYQKMAASVTYGDFMLFMESGFIQKATNALHDVFCAGGLTVLTQAGGRAFKVYGDDAMFKAGSSEGVKESGITANMSRDSIMSIINTGDDGGKTTASILDRLPSRVQFKNTNGAVIDEPIETWHNSNKRGYLKDQCMTTVFPDMSGSFMQKIVPGVFGSSLGTITRDSNVHGQDAF
ncbi:MAG TPA: hypothetical protein VG184_09360 [Acidimicrobiales bacterium]|nr:hypothetical protein [Acidimicrobiales bacterium]